MNHIINNILLTQNLTYLLRAYRKCNLMAEVSIYVVMLIFLKFHIYFLETNVFYSVFLIK